MFFVGNSEQNVQEKMHPHYMKDHKDVMRNGNEEKRKVWMEEFQKNWDSAETL